jgi:hypothetical protein
MADLWAAMCLVLVLEGLVLFAAPGAWKRAIAQLLELVIVADAGDRQLPADQAMRRLEHERPSSGVRPWHRAIVRFREWLRRSPQETSLMSY